MAEPRQTISIQLDGASTLPRTLEDVRKNYCNETPGCQSGFACFWTGLILCTPVLDFGPGRLRLLLRKQLPLLCKGLDRCIGGNGIEPGTLDPP